MLIVLKEWAKQCDEGEPVVGKFTWTTKERTELEIGGVRVSWDKLGRVVKRLLRSIEDSLQELTFGVPFSTGHWKSALIKEDVTKETVGWSPIEDQGQLLLQSIFTNAKYQSKGSVSLRLSLLFRSLCLLSSLFLFFFFFFHSFCLHLSPSISLLI